MILPGPTFSGYVAVQVPENASKIYTDDAVRQMFASAVIRNEVPVEEQLGLMPFKISELSSFKNVRTLAPGAALILADGDEKTGFEAAPFMIIGLIGSTPAHARRSRPLCPADRDHHSRRARRQDHDVRAGPHRRPARLRDADRRHQRQGQYAGHHRAMAAVRRARPRCASSAASPRDDWTKAFPRFRAVRDGIQPRGLIAAKFAQGRAETSGFRSYTNGTSFSRVGFINRGDAPCLLAGWF